MSFLSKLSQQLFPKAPPTGSATRAKERLSVILASQRGSELLAGVNMDALQKDVLDVVRRHIAGVAETGSAVQCVVKNEGDVKLFEMSVEIDGLRNVTSVGVGGVTLNASGAQ